ncbi:ammonia-forming cytochrome c nitrite reductase subunit c552 [Candidatus Hydrogenedentota bacterium]
MRAAKTIIVMGICLFLTSETLGMPDSEGYAGSSSCIDCHEEIAKRYAKSNHSYSMRKASADTVVADFTDDNTFTFQGMTSKMFIKDDKYWMHTEGPGGKMGTFEVEYVIGRRMLQWFLTSFKDGRLQVLPVWWDVSEKRWYECTQSWYGNTIGSMDPGDRIMPDQWRFWANHGQTYNYVCYDCHSSQMVKNYSFKKDSYSSTWNDEAVNCESCHGPAGQHVKFHQKKQPEGAVDTSLVKLAGLSAEKEVELCSSCHSVKETYRAGYKPGDDAIDYFRPLLLDRDLFHADGQPESETYEHVSFLQSSCYTEGGLKCTSCHDPHGSENACDMKFPGGNDEMCTSCHAADKYGPEHSVHSRDMVDILCVDCHMVSSNFHRMSRIDHSIRSPIPRLTEKYRIPNACTNCHPNKSARWAAEMCEGWYGKDYAEESIRMADAVVKAREGNPAATATLGEVLADSKAKLVHRASAAALLGQIPNEKSVGPLLKGLDDPDPLVRGLSAGSLMNFAPISKVRKRLLKALDDEKLFVRSNAAMALCAAPFAGLSAEEKKKLAEPLAEYRSMLGFNPDDPATHYNLANMEYQLGNREKAVENYKKALKLEFDFHPARYNLAMSYVESGDAENALKEFRRILDIDDEFADAHYAVGLLLAETGDLEAAAESLEGALRVNPDYSDARYNLALIKEKRGDVPAAIKDLKKIFYEDEPYLLKSGYALAAIMYGSRDFACAEKVCERMISEEPDFAESYGMLFRICMETGRADEAREYQRLYEEAAAKSARR